MNDDKIRQHIASEEKKIADVKSAILSGLEDLGHVVRQAIESGFYDGRIHQAAARLLEKDAEFRALEMARIRMVAIEPSKETP